MKRFILYLSLFHLAFVPTYLFFGVYPPGSNNAYEWFGKGSVLTLLSAATAPLILATLTWTIEYVALRAANPILRLGKQTIFLAFAGIVSLALFWRVLNLASPTNADHLRSFGGSTPIYLGILVVVLAVLVFLVFSGRFRHQLVRLVSFVVYILAPFALLSLINISFLIAGSSSEETGKWPPDTPSSVEQGIPSNVVILLFDELDYEFVFENSKVVDGLPNFRDLAATSLVMHNYKNTHAATFASVPEILTGYSLEGNIAGADDTPLLLETGRSVPLRSQRNLFDLAVDEGYSTAIFGSYLRYCSHFVKATNIDKVYCRSGDTDRLFSALIKPYHQALVGLPTLPKINGPMDDGVAHRRLAKVLDCGCGIFAYAHYKTPHWPFYYNPEAERLELFKRYTYSDNLRWADKLLGEVMRDLKALGIWDDTLLIVIADHYYRGKTKSYYDGPKRGSDDTRVPLLMKLPGMTQAVSYDEPYNSRFFFPLVEELYARSAFDPNTVTIVMRSLDPPEG